MYGEITPSKRMFMSSMAMTRFLSCWWHVIPVQLQKNMVSFQSWRWPSGSPVMPCLNLSRDWQSVEFLQRNVEVDSRARKLREKNTATATGLFWLYAILSLSLTVCVQLLEFDVRFQAKSFFSHLLGKMRWTINFLKSLNLTCIILFNTRRDQW